MTEFPHPGAVAIEEGCHGEESNGGKARQISGPVIVCQSCNRRHSTVAAVQDERSCKRECKTPPKVVMYCSSEHGKARAEEGSDDSVGRDGGVGVQEVDVDAVGPTLREE